MPVHVFASSSASCRDGECGGGHVDGRQRMWFRSIRLRLAVLGSALLVAWSLASSAAHAQQRDEAWVISQITAGRFEELRSIEKLSDEGVPFAMYWWSSLMQLCVFDRCDQQGSVGAPSSRGQVGSRPRPGRRLRSCRPIAGSGDHRHADGRGRGPEGWLRATDACHPVGGRPIQQGRPKGACRLRCPGHVGAAPRAACRTREAGGPVETRS
jgi:hypothetical protein